jgi:hypothetical protein
MLMIDVLANVHGSLFQKCANDSFCVPAPNPSSKFCAPLLAHRS